MALYSVESFPFTETCCEGYVWRNLEMRCFARTESIISEEFKNLPALRKAVEKSAQKPGVRDDWDLVPAEFKTDPVYSSQVLTSGMLYVLGKPACKGADSRCIPIFRPGYLYVFKASGAPWFATGTLCLRYSNEGTTTGKFLVKAGVAKARPDVDSSPVGDAPCVEMPSLAAAYNHSLAFLATLDPAVKKGLVNKRRRLSAEEEEEARWEVEAAQQRWLDYDMPIGASSHGRGGLNRAMNLLY
jgi:hypothetical protein